MGISVGQKRDHSVPAMVLIARSMESLEPAVPSQAISLTEDHTLDPRP